MKAFRGFVLAFLGVALSVTAAAAQSSPGLQANQVPTAGQWNSYFAAKQDYLGFAPLNPSSLLAAAPITVTSGSGVLTVGLDPAGVVSVASIAAPIHIIAAPATLSGTSGTLASTNLIVNASGTFTLTLPNAVTSTGRLLLVKSITAQAVNSSSSNVVPPNSATPGSVLFTATAGKWAIMVSDGTNWIIMAAN